MEKSSHLEGRADLSGPRPPRTQTDTDRPEPLEGLGNPARQPLQRLVRMQEIARFPFENPLDRLFLTLRGNRIEEELRQISAELDRELAARRGKDEQAA